MIGPHVRACGFSRQDDPIRVEAVINRDQKERQVGGPGRSKAGAAWTISKPRLVEQVFERLALGGRIQIPQQEHRRFRLPDAFRNGFQLFIS